MTILTVKEVSDLLRVAPSTIYQWASEGFIPHVKLAGALRFEKEKIEEWVRRRREPGRTERVPS